MTDMYNIEECFLEVEKIVKDTLKNIGYRVELLKYGSTVNGLALRGDSDLDLTIIIDNLNINHNEILSRLRKAIFKKNRFMNPFINSIKSGVILSFKDNKNNIDVEITVNKVIEVCNSALIYTYAMVDSRFLDLALLLKRWNKKKFPNNHVRINSYSIVLMLIGVL